LVLRPRRSHIYAIVRSGGKQYRVEVGSKIEVERLSAAEGDKVELADVLLLSDGKKVTSGNPTVAGAKVMTQVIEQGRSPKAVIFKYKAKVRYRRRTGHRQPFTRLAVEDIVAPGFEVKKAVEAPVAEAVAPAASAQTTRTRRRAPAKETAAKPEKTVAKAPRRTRAKKESEAKPSKR
jgi:large subunit ribosomal protein L21